MISHCTQDICRTPTVSEIHLTWPLLNPGQAFCGNMTEDESDGRELPLTSLGFILLLFCDIYIYFLSLPIISDRLHLHVRLQGGITQEGNGRG